MREGLNKKKKEMKINKQHNFFFVIFEKGGIDLMVMKHTTQYMNELRKKKIKQIKTQVDDA